MNDPVWSFLNLLPFNSACMLQWNRILSDCPQAADFKKHFLSLTKDKVDSIPCDTDCDFSCPRRIVRHSDDDIVAICDEGEPEVQVSRSDLLVYQLKQSAINRALCSALAISFKESSVNGLCSTWNVGEFVPTEGFRYPVFVTMQKTERTLFDICRQLCHTQDGPFTLIIPSRCGLTPSIEELLAQKKCALGVLAEDFNINKSTFTVNRTPEIIFKPLLDQVPEADSGGTVFFQTPKGTTWEDIKIQFRDNHTVRIWAGEKTGMYTYSDMGMSNQRNKKPTKQWVAFLAFAATEGAIDWNSELAATNLKSQKAALSKRLRAFFHLEDDPIYWDDSSGSYRCRFTILSEGTDDSW
ncbi:hypothetical protein P4E94_02320 [Pontiellaceae bacterium B12219]|nr:hypothetical protein [Pontiellaceae bacterium B12219]